MKLSKKEKEVFWREFKRQLRRGQSIFPELMLGAYYQKQFDFVKEYLLNENN